MPMSKPLVVLFAAAALFLMPGSNDFSFGPDAAYAKGNGNSGGNGGGKGGNGKAAGKSGGDNGRSTGTSFSPKKSTSSTTAKPIKRAAPKPVKSTAVKSSPRPTGKPEVAKVNHGALASELKGLNAAHASPTALANASPNSQVGRIAAYAAAVNAVAEAEQNLGDAQTALNELLDNPPRSIEAIQADIDALADPEGADADALAALNDEMSAAESYDDRVAGLEGDIETYETLIAEGPETQNAALLEASNGRELSPEALAELHDLLGLPAPKPEVEGDETAELPEGGEPLPEPETERVEG